MVAGNRPYSSVDISSAAFWSALPEVQDTSFAALRRDGGVTWHPPLEGSMSQMEGDAGFWALTTHAELCWASQHPEVLSSAGENGGALFDNVPIEVLEFSASFLILDPPQHTKLRRLISSAFTPRRVAMIEAQIRRQAASIVDSLMELPGEVDFVEQVASRLPMWTMREMVGVPERFHDEMVEAANLVVGFSEPGDDGVPPELAMLAAAGTLIDIAGGLIAERRAHPEDDLLSALVQAEVDGERLTDNQINAFFVLLCAAGTDTSRNGTALAMKALSDHPGQWKLLASDTERVMGTAVEEFVRWASPVTTFRRTATVDVELGGQSIRAGEKVVLFYRSANRDEAVFVDPYRFDITRSPNKHVGFGGGGPHYCLGVSLAKSQLRAVFTELVHRVERIEVGDPEYVPGATLVRGVKKLPCTFSARAHNEERRHEDGP
jgi:cytochrome P450